MTSPEQQYLERCIKGSRPYFKNDMTGTPLGYVIGGVAWCTVLCIRRLLDAESSPSLFDTDWYSVAMVRSMSCWTCSACMFFFGWYFFILAKLFRIESCSVYENLDANWGPLSGIIVYDIPYKTFKSFWKAHIAIGAITFSLLTPIRACYTSSS